MDPAVQWNWVILAYGFAYAAMVLFTASVAARITRARQRLVERS
ncbi:MAG: hypothetical protein ACC654_07550 [Acidimicrobiia bacterium]